MVTMLKTKETASYTGRKQVYSEEHHNLCLPPDIISDKKIKRAGSPRYVAGKTRNAYQIPDKYIIGRDHLKGPRHR
jgi:hypothetical protein